MGGVEPMIIMSNERQKTLFINTVNQFKHDIVYLQGCMDVVLSEHAKYRHIGHDSLALIAGHLAQMSEMLNDFEVRLNNHE